MGFSKVLDDFVQIHMGFSEVLDGFAEIHMGFNKFGRVSVWSCGFLLLHGL